jgi:formylglycine-generating enzyme required for sulfatase activity
MNKFQIRSLLTLLVLSIVVTATLSLTAKKFSSSRHVGETFQDCPECPTMVYLPSGSFQMGSNENTFEEPIHNVTIKQFSMGETEVTFDQWDACFNAKGCSHRPDDEGKGRGTQAVIDVSWNDVQEYTKWLNTKTGNNYRLPSESEWEYAARAGTTTTYSWGNSINCSQAKYFDYNDECDIVESKGFVKSFNPNNFGLYDMHGNVWEYVEDKWHDDYKGSPNDGSAWNSGTSKKSVIRSGSRFHFPEFLRSATRNSSILKNRQIMYGFRVALDK